MHRFFIFKTVSTFLFPGVSEYFGCYLSIDKRLAEHLAFIVSVFILTGCFFSTISILGPDQSCSSPVFVLISSYVSAWLPLPHAETGESRTKNKHQRKWQGWTSETSPEDRRPDRREASPVMDQN